MSLRSFLTLPSKAQPPSLHIRSGRSGPSKDSELRVKPGVGALAGTPRPGGAPASTAWATRQAGATFQPVTCRLGSRGLVV